MKNGEREKKYFPLVIFHLSFAIEKALQNLCSMTFALDRIKPATRTPTMHRPSFDIAVLSRSRQALYHFALIFRQFIPRASYAVAP
jgi:hypothetical protein